ncbi:MAG: O-antigen ligase family protein [Planctomycetes bacterium]|nr:O-antigen ligase family protein [Planctomycetota bacterium]
MSLVLGAWVALEGAVGWEWQRDLLGPEPSILNDLPYLGSLSFLALTSAWIAFLLWVRASGSVRRPALGLLILALFADVIPGLYQFGLLLSVLVLTHQKIQARSQPKGRHAITPLIFPLLWILVVYVTSLLTAERPVAILLDFQFRVSAMAALPLLPLFVRTPEDVNFVFRCLLGGAALTALIGLVQFAWSMATDQIVTLGDSEFNRMTTPFGVMPRCTGLMLHPNQQSNVLGTIGILALWFATAPRERVPRPGRGALWGMFLLCSLAVLVTFSRSGWMALGLGALVIPAIRWRRLAVGYALTVLAVGVWGMQSGWLSTVISEVRDLNASSADFRWHIDALALEAFTHFPWWGVGVGGMLDFWNPYHLEVHNTYLQILAEMGVAGSLGFLALGGWLTCRLLGRIRNTRTLSDREWLVGLALASIVLLVQNLVAMFLWVKFLWVWMALCEASVLVSLDRWHPNSSHTSADHAH